MKIYDCFGCEVKENDTLLFDSGSKYKVVSHDGVLTIKCLDQDLPEMKLQNICLDNTLVSAKVVHK